MSQLHAPVLAWYQTHARSLPWREPSASAWGVLVSELMLQQTPVVRVLPAYRQWMRTWPTAGHLAEASVGEAIRAWGRLGYPRRAVRLHRAATVIVADHDGEVPSSLAELRALPGVGEYTAAAVASFAFGQRQLVLDTNVRRVLARAVAGVELPARTVTSAERELAGTLLPSDPATAAGWAVGVMELGALVCSAASPACGACPITAQCRWRELGYPAHDGPRRRAQTYAGTDRHARGALLGVLREAAEPVTRSRLDAAWTHHEQRERCLTSLLVDGLVVRLAHDRYSLP
ncbi:MAG: A/G-specific adenine glycosylase [uncultured Nocardioidaceae bacterium]|uniref:Adenine DNA glycosylase n=1 Tax=uncultured Nocardioidaceae bacterium TaxID=253824 RepID=A0A6J4MHA7_9ACTN|nr:MAG: A/G-specific adenine glycosylase [uncultured Nocardioidaceae bacterium]